MHLELIYRLQFALGIWNPHFTWCGCIHCIWLISPGALAIISPDTLAIISPDALAIIYFSLPDSPGIMTFSSVYWCTCNHETEKLTSIFYLEAYLEPCHCVWSVKIRIFFWSISFCIWSEYQKNGPEKAPYLDTFQAVCQASTMEVFSKIVYSKNIESWNENPFACFTEFKPKFEDHFISF